MFKRVNRLLIELPVPEHGDANAAAAVQNLLGGKFGEMSTLNNYMFQSFNFRCKKKLKTFYDLVASITAEEFGHVELVSTTINLLSRGLTHPGDPDSAPLRRGLKAHNLQYFIATAQTSYPMDSMGNPWNGTFVHSSGNLIEDMLHNFFLEIGARTQKMRVYEMTDHPTAREMIGYLTGARRHAHSRLRQGPRNPDRGVSPGHASRPQPGQFQIRLRPKIHGAGAAQRPFHLEQQRLPGYRQDLERKKPGNGGTPLRGRRQTGGRSRAGFGSLAGGVRAGADKGPLHAGAEAVEGIDVKRDFTSETEKRHKMAIFFFKNLPPWPERPFHPFSRSSLQKKKRLPQRGRRLRHFPASSWYRWQATQCWGRTSCQAGTASAQMSIAFGQRVRKPATARED